MLAESIFIVKQLNEEPFVKNLSYPLFESLSPLALMEILNEVLTEIQPKHAENIQDKTAEETVQEIILLLLVLEYEPVEDCCDLQEITEGLEKKDKVAIYPILFWLLQDVPALKKKAYLAQFTIEVEVPEYLQQDKTINILINKQRELIQTFQHHLSMYEDLQPSCISKNNMIADNKMMQNNKCCLLKQRDKLQKELELSVKSPEQLLKAARRLWLEMEREKDLAQQTQEQAEQLSQAQQRLSELREQSRGLSGAGVDPSSIMADLQRDIKTNTLKVTETLPAELEDMKKKVNVLQILAKSPVVTVAQVLEIQNQIKNVNSKINKHNMEMAISRSCEEEKLNSMREKALAITQNKNSKARKLQDLKERLESAKREYNVCAKQEGARDGGRSLRKELEFKIKVLRKKYQEVAKLKKTERTLKRRKRNFQPLVQILEAEKGKPGPSEVLKRMRKVLERTVAVKRKEHSQTHKAKMGKMKSMMESLRSNVSAMMEEHSLDRRQCHELPAQFEGKRTYGARTLTQKVTSLRDKNIELEKQFIDKKSLLEVNRTKIEAAMEELKAYQLLAGDPRTKSKGKQAAGK